MSALKRGYQPTPLITGTKQPSILRGWQSFEINEMNFDTYLNGQLTAFGVINGARSRGLVDVDLDTPMAVALAPSFLPTTGYVFGRKSKRKSHHLYEVNDPRGTVRFRDPGRVLTGEPEEKGTIVELRSTASQTMWPGSVHPNGERVEWDEKTEPSVVEWATLRYAVATIAAAEMFVHYYPSRGSRDDFHLWLTAGLMRLGWEDDAIRNFTVTIALAAGDDEAQSRDKVERTRERLEEGRPTKGWRALREEYNEDVIKRVREWLDTPIENEPRRYTSVDSFVYLYSENRYIYKPTSGVWTSWAVDWAVGQVRVGVNEEGEDETVPGSQFIAEHTAVHQLVWAPGETQIIEGRVFDEGGWRPHTEVRAFNAYRGPHNEPGDASDVAPWLEHVRRVYPKDAEHLLNWFAHRVQHPGTKINHALVLGGEQGVGKDTILVPLEHAVGTWNYAHVTPSQVVGRFNSFLKSVVLHVSEARDMGEVNRYSFYDRMKDYIAAPPDGLRVDEKNMKEYYILNVCGVVFTTNNRTGGLYIPPGDRRHYVTWSELPEGSLPQSYFDELYAWYYAGGLANVAAYLRQRDISGFNPKARPPQTHAFWVVVNANRAPEESEISSALDALGAREESGECVWPDAVTISQLVTAAEDLEHKANLASSLGLSGWLTDRRNRRTIPHRMDAVGYIEVQNPDTPSTGLWRIGSHYCAVYAKKTLTVRDQLAAAMRLKETLR